jgi:HSP20 family protein
LDRFNHDFDRAWKNFFSLGNVFDNSRFLAPALDVAETENEWVVKAELPGLKDEDVEVNLQDGLLTIKGDKREKQEDKKKHYHRVERRFGAFCRSVQLPSGVNGDGVAATFKDGVLEVILPKADEAKAKKIEVN